MNFRNELVQEAHQLPVPNTSLDAIITTARVRTRRRRVAASTLAAGFVIAGGAVGIQQLSAARNTTNQATAPVPTVPTVADEATVPNDEGAIDGLEAELHIDGAIPAQPAAANITWSIVDGNSPEALASLFNPADRYALATLPSASPEEPPQQQLFEHGADGSWNPIEFNKVESLKPVISGDTIYGLGTAPATAGGAPGAFGIYDPASGSWQLQDLPEAIRPYQSDKVETSLYYSTVPVDGGLLVIVDSTTSMLKWDAFPQFMDDPTPPIIKDGVVYRYLNCDGTALGGPVGESVDAAYEEFLDADFDQLLTDNCDEEAIDPAQLGLSQSDIDALQRPSTAPSVWKLTSDAMVPAEIPGLPLDGVDELYVNGNTVIVYRGASEIYTIGSDGAATRVFADLPPEAAEITWPGASDGNRALAAAGQYLFTATPGASTQITDLASAVLTPDMVNTSLMVGRTSFAGPLSVATVDLNYATNETMTEPTTISNSGYSLVINAEGYSIIDDATGAEPLYGYDLSTESGKVDLMLYPDTPIAPPATVPEMTEGDYSMMTEGDYPEPEKVASFDIPWTAVPGLNSQWKSLVLTSVDGVNFAVTDLEQVLGGNVWIGAVETTSDGRVVISAFRNDTGEDVVLVGTPN